MSYEERLKKISGNDPYWFQRIDKFILENFDDKDLGLIQIENLMDDKESFNEFTKMLNYTKDEDLGNIIEQVKGLNLSFKYSQDELKDFFYHQMNENELQKINNLNLREVISKLETDKYKIKYIDNVGYIDIGEGYLILADGTEPTHYFAKIFTDADFLENKY